jgi:general secretion pathway protein D
MKRGLARPVRIVGPAVVVAVLWALGWVSWRASAQLSTPSSVLTSSPPAGSTGSPPATSGQTPESNAASPVTSPATGPTTQASLNFKDAPIDAVLDYLSEAAGYVIVREVPIDGRATVMSKRPVNPQEAIALLRTVLSSNGCTVVQNGRELRIVSREKAKKADLPVHYGADPEAIEGTDELITQVIPITNMDAVKLRADLTPLIGTDADVTANEASNAIVITDTSSNVRRVVRVISALDKRESASSDLRIVQLHFAQASATAKLLLSIFQGESGSSMTPQQMQQMMQQGQAVAPGRSERSGRIPGNGIDQALHGGHVSAVADDRTNSLIITAPTETLKLIDNILKELDSNPEPAAELKAIALKYADADATAKLLNSTFKPDDGGGGRNLFAMLYGMATPEAQHEHINITADPRTNSLIVSAPADAMKQIESLITQLDANPATTSEMKVFTLKHADAFDAADLIKDIFPTEKEGSNPLRYLFFGASPSTASPRGAKVTAASDDRTNTLIVTAPSELMKTIGDLVSQLDVNPASEDTLFIYRLKNGQATNLETVLNSLFGNYNEPGQGNGARPNPQQPQQVQNGQNGQNGQGNQGFARAGGAGSGGQPGGTGIGARHGTRNGQPNAGAAQSRLSPGSAKATSELTGKVFVVADTDTNSLLVTTAVKYEEKVREIIGELDRPVPQVLIKVLIAEVTHDRSDDLGADYSVINVRPSGNGTTITQNLGNAAAAVTSGGLSVAVVESNVTATLHALAQADKLDVLSRPYILTSDNQEATITVGDEVPFITDTRITDTGQTINTLQYQDIGIILDVTPHINPDGLVILDVAPEISQLTGQTVPISQGVAAPVFAKRSAQSRVGIVDGQTIVIGGLMQDQKTQTITKIPFLGDLPVVGAAFTRYQNTKTKTELLIFLTPHVAQLPDSLRPMSGDELRGTKLTPNAVEPGTFQDHLRGMLRGGGIQTQPSTEPAVFPSRPTSNPSPPDALSVPPANRTVGLATTPAKPVDCYAVTPLACSWQARSAAEGLLCLDERGPSLRSG